MTLIIAEIIEDNLIIVGDSMASFEGQGFENKDKELIEKYGISKSIIFEDTCICFAGIFFQNGKSVVAKIESILFSSENFDWKINQLLEFEHLDFIIATMNPEPRLVSIKNKTFINCQKCYIGNGNAYNEFVSDLEQKIEKNSFPSIRISYVFEDINKSILDRLTNYFSSFHKLIFRNKHSDVKGFIFSIIANENKMDYVPYLCSYSVSNSPVLIQQRMPGTNFAIRTIMEDKNIIPIDLSNNTNDSYSYYVTSVKQEDSLKRINFYLFENQKSIYFNGDEIQLISASNLISIQNIIEKGNHYYNNIFQNGPNLFSRLEFKFHESGLTSNEKYYYKAELLDYILKSDHLGKESVLRISSSINNSE